MQIVILGAGIAGLSLGYFIQLFHPQHEVIIIESTSRPGGWIRSELLDDVLIEYGPRGLRGKGASAMMHLLDSLQLNDKVVLAADAAKHRYVLHKNRLMEAPKDLIVDDLWGALCAIIKEWRTPASHLSDESVYAFFERRIGKKWTDKLIDPALTGIWAADLHKLSMKACLPALWHMEKEHHSLIKAMLKKKWKKKTPSAPLHLIEKAPLFSFRNGLETLPKHIVAAFKGRILLNETVLSIQEKTVTTSSCTWHPDRIFSALAPSALTKIFADAPDIPAASLVLAHGIFPKKQLHVHGFGYLTPSQSNEKVLGAVFDSQTFPELYPTHGCVTVMMGGMRHPELIDASDEYCLGIAKDALWRHASLLCDQWNLNRVHQAIPQYTMGHLEKIHAFQEAHPECTWLGSGFGELSVTRIIEKSYQLAQSI